ncbi:MAG: transketolase [Thermoplasmata archaeon]|nr:MAG: transketolase [Thermoplasmata archaeon]
MTVYDEEIIQLLEQKANVIRKHVVRMIHEAGSGHPGGSLSAVDILTALYFHKAVDKTVKKGEREPIMNYDPSNPRWEDRDRFILSKGHAAPALYAVLAEAGYFDRKPLLAFLNEKNGEMYDRVKQEKVFKTNLLMTVRKLGYPLQGHPDMNKTPGVEASTGSEGQGLSIGVGQALAAKLDRKLYHIFVMIGDGELDCGQIWEAAMSAAHFKLDNLIAIIDRNKLQLDGPTEQIMSLEPIPDKWQSFGWHVIEIDGHNFKEILSALDTAKDVKGKPTIIVAHTVKGKGVSFMEGAVHFHGKAPDDEQFKQAMDELESDSNA